MSVVLIGSPPLASAASTFFSGNGLIPASSAKARSDWAVAASTCPGSPGVPNHIATLVRSAWPGTIAMTWPDLSPAFTRWAGLSPTYRTGIAIARGTTNALSTFSTNSVPVVTFGRSLHQ